MTPRAEPSGGGHGDWRTAEARAKVNLRLRIFPPGPDGYHPLETIFCRISLADTLRLRRREEPGLSLEVTGPEAVAAGPDNLATRAAELWLSQSRATGLGAGPDFGIDIELEKKIPAGAGLGGGSSDAATVLALLDESVPEPLGAKRLLELAGRLGADVPFFVADVPIALGWWRGDRLLPLSSPPPRPVLLAIPRARVETSAAYAWWDEAAALRRSPEPAVLSPAAPKNWEAIRDLAINDFEPLVFERHPQIEELRAALETTDPTVVLLSGSGSAVFAVYADVRRRDAARDALSSVEDVGWISANAPA